jgi:processive 1,2-diacylglycerol beta-glucosyltransferase
LDHPKTILILHASAGHGHAMAADALKEGLLQISPESTIEVHDALDFGPRWLKRIYVGFYLFLIHKAPLMWGCFYAITDQRLFSLFHGMVRRLFNGSFFKRLEEKIIKEKPDIVFSTHFLPAEIMAHLKRTRQTQAKGVTVVTDFLVHRFWLFQECDVYAVAAEATRQDLRRLGIPDAHIQVTGIPIDPKFIKSQDRKSLCQKLSLSSEVFTVLLTSGGSGAGPFIRLFKFLKSIGQIQLVVICGNNEELLNQLKQIAKDDPGLKPKGFIDNMDEFMECADVVVGKAGGLTLSEALAKRKPFIVVSAVPGQETHNAHVLVNAKAGYWVRRFSDLPDIVKNLKRFPDIYVNAVDRLRKPEAAIHAAQAGLEALKN